MPIMYFKQCRVCRKYLINACKTSSSEVIFEALGEAKIYTSLPNLPFCLRLSLAALG